MRKLIAAAALLICAIGSAHAGCYIANYDANGIPNEVCTNNTSGGGAPAYVDKWTAIAVSKSTLTAGSAHGQDSMNAAQQLALANCSSARSDCKLQAWDKNTCLAFAISLNGASGYGNDPNRLRAQAKAMTQCRANQGQNCSVQASPCASDDPRWPSPSN